MIAVEDLEFTYPRNEVKTLRGLSFSVSRGEIFGFLGPSGAGKTTTQNILIGLLRHYEGQVKVLQRELRQVKNDYYEKIGIAFEFPNFYSRFTALENLNFFGSLYGGAVAKPEELLELVGLAKDAHTRVSDFSKGMKMRLNFIRALLHRPEVIFLDEPTSGLDPVNARKIKEIILEQKAAGKTILLTTHNMFAAEELCDRVAFIVDGQIKLIDSPRELKISRGKKAVRVEYRENGEIRVAEFELEGVGHDEEFYRLLNDKSIERMHTQEASLEDIFIEVTGRSLT